ncbi:hypothetical protein LJC15_04195 [Desulfovibrio sp. OttesenSCG-928-G11]|nr:hypothetical protein [Desulfovibrio sp. OttesenSCG-928-G11]
MTTITAEERPTIDAIVGIISSVVCDEECPVETGGPACLKERTRCMDAYQREAEKIYAQVVEPLKEEIEALYALVEALEQKCNALRYPGPTDYAGHLEAAMASLAVDTARARLQEVRNAKS